jgi:AcrR family transcriptional regulator
MELNPSLKRSRRGWRRRKAARPSEILAAALQVIAEEGIAGARMDDIAKRAGVTKGTIYLYFENKDVLFKSLLLSSTDATVLGSRSTAPVSKREAPGRRGALASRTDR